MRHLCVELTLKEIIFAEVLKKSSQHLVYKIEIITKPNNGVYEVLLHEGLMQGFEFKSNHYRPNNFITASQ